MEIPDNDVCQYRTTLEVSTSDMDWLNSEVYEWLATKTTGVALIGSGGSDWNAKPAGSSNKGQFSLCDAIGAGQADHGTPAWVLVVESEFQRGRMAELDDDTTPQVVGYLRLHATAGAAAR